MKQQSKRGSYSDFGRMRARMDRIFGEMMVSGRWTGPCEYRTWHPPTDVYETDAHYVVRMEVAGMNDGDFTISIADRALVVTGVRQDPSDKLAYHQIEILYGGFRSEVVLPGPVDDGDVEAVYSDGFLRVVLLKRPVQKVPVVEV
jgi:HSP20 family protein